MARSAVGDTRHTQDTIRSLAEAAERIGSVVGANSAIAGQTRSRRRAPDKTAKASPWSPPR